MLSPAIARELPEYHGGSASSQPCSRSLKFSAPAWHLRAWCSTAVAALSLTCRGGRGTSRRADSSVAMRARNDMWFETVKTTELEEALRALGFDGFPKMQNRHQVASWIQKLRIPYELVEGALKEVRQARKAAARRSAGRSSDRSKNTKKSPSKESKQKAKFKDAGLNRFSEAQLRTVLNICGVQGTSVWPKQELVQKLRGMGLRQRDVQDVLNEVSPQSRPPRRGSKNRKGSRPKSRAEREFYGQSNSDFVREFIKEEYDDWDDRYDDVDDYFDFTMDEEPWESIPWDFDDYLDDAHEESQYRSSRRTSGQDYYYYDPGQDPWTRSTASPGGSSWPRQRHMTPEETMTLALREGWTSESMSKLQALQLLGLTSRPSAAEVSKVRRQMALKWHPDKNPENANAAAAFQLVMAAASKLS